MIIELGNEDSEFSTTSIVSRSKSFVGSSRNRMSAFFNINSAMCALASCPPKDLLTVY